MKDTIESKPTNATVNVTLTQGMNRLMSVKRLVFCSNWTVATGKPQLYSTTKAVAGFDEFLQSEESSDQHVVTGRGWTVPDLRRKSFEDLHKLWFILYKERNLLLTSKQTLRRQGREVVAADENRYVKVKRAMGGIKFVLNERRKIDDLINKPN